MSRPFVWQMVKEAVESLNGKANYSQIREYIQNKYKDVNESTITCQIIVCSVNHPSRIHYTENYKPRHADSQYDFLFNTGRGQVEFYNPERHGEWEIVLNEYGKLQVRQLMREGETIEGESDSAFGFPLEAHLRDFIAKNISEIQILNMKLHLFKDSNGRDGIEYPTDVGPIDILAQDDENNFVIFELKLSKGPDRALGQILRYMGWIQKNIAVGKKIFGILVAEQIDEKTKYAVSLVPQITIYEYKVHFELSNVKL
jgi:endonuclease